MVSTCLTWLSTPWDTWCFFPCLTCYFWVPRCQRACRKPPLSRAHVLTSLSRTVHVPCTWVTQGICSCPISQACHAVAPIPPGYFSPFSLPRTPMTNAGFPTPSLVSAMTPAGFQASYLFLMLPAIPCFYTPSPLDPNPMRHCHVFQCPMWSTSLTAW